MKPCEVFEKVSAHQVEGMMLHDQLADGFHFLALPGFAHMHEKQFEEESREMRKVKKYFISRMNVLLGEGRPENPHALPKSWMNYTRQQVTADSKRKAVRELMERWVSWEKETKKLYSEAWAMLTEAGEIAAACMIKELLRDVDEELSRAEELHLRMEAVTYDMATVDQIQVELEKDLQK